MAEPGKHQKRTELAAQGSTQRTYQQDERAALWQIAHSLAAIADALEADDRLGQENPQ